MKFCSYCGAGLDADMRFCPKCGKPFEESKDNPHISGKHLKPESPIYDSTPVSAPPKKKKRGGIIALVIIAVLIVASAGLFFSGVFVSKGKPKIPFSDDTAAIAQASNSVVMLNCYDKEGELFATGSGFAAFDDGIIVTNYHVIEHDTYRVTAQTESGASFECPTVIAYDADKDIAILKADRQTGLMLLAPGKTEDLQKGEKVVAIGSPLGLINSVSTGVFSGYIDDDEVGKALQFTAAISHGSSGGALFNNAGEVIGITFASLSDGQNLNMAVPIEEAIRMYNSTDRSKAQSLAMFYEIMHSSSKTTGIESEELRKLVDALNEEELAQRTDDDPSIGIFECGSDKNTIYYKFAMKLFKYVIEYARNGDAENIKTYYRLLDSFPSLESSLEKALQESRPGLDVIVVFMVDEKSTEVAAVFNDGKILYDIMNGSGTIPVEITPIENTSDAQLALDSIDEIMAGHSDLQLAEQNQIMIEFIKSQYADDLSQKRNISKGDELLDELNKAQIDFTQAAIDNSPDIPLEVKNKVLIDYIRSLVK